MKENRFVIMRNRLKSREMVIQEEKEREKTLETMYEVDLLIDSALRRAEDGKFLILVQDGSDWAGPRFRRDGVRWIESMGIRISAIKVTELGLVAF